MINYQQINHPGMLLQLMQCAIYHPAFNKSLLSGEMNVVQKLFPIKWEGTGLLVKENICLYTVNHSIFMTDYNQLLFVNLEL